jgi:hypothetical protein
VRRSADFSRKEAHVREDEEAVANEISCRHSACLPIKSYIRIGEAMRRPITRHRASQFVLWLILAFALSGCFKVRTTIDIKPDGSGTLGMAVGITQQAKELLASQSEGKDPMQSITESLSEQLGVSNPQDMNVKRWTEGEYEWVQGDVDFRDLNDLNERVSRSDYFESFSVTRQSDIFRDRFVLNGRLKPLKDSAISNPDDTPSPGGMPGLSNADPATFIEIQAAVRLPGNVVQTNGVRNSGSSEILWTASSDQTVTMQATSESWNWLNIGIAGSAVGVGILAIAGVALFLTGTSRSKSRKSPATARVTPDRLSSVLSSSSNSKGVVKTSPQPQVHTQADATSSVRSTPPISPVAPTDMLATIGARSLLQDVNHFLLKDAGTIREAPGEVLLEWPVLPGAAEMHTIHIRLLSQQQIMVNGEIFPTTQEGVKMGIVNCLRKIRR